MRKYDYSFVNNELVPANLITIIGKIYSLKTKLEITKQAKPELFYDLEKTANFKSVKNSCDISGITTSDKYIKLIVDKHKMPANRDESEMAGYRDALNMVNSNYRNMEFDEKTILKLHKTIMYYTLDGQGGQYKKKDNIIVEFDQDGNKKTIFKPISAKETKTAMEKLVKAYTKAKDNPDINQLLLIPCVILDFLCTNPFKTGNGRVSRLLTLLLLYKNGFDIGRYSSYAEQINKGKGYYYEAIKASTENWATNKNTYMMFTSNFLSNLYGCYKELEDKM